MDALETAIRHAVTNALQAEARGTFAQVLLDVLPRALRRASLPPFLSRKELAEATGLSMSGIDAMRRSRRLPHIKVGSRVFFKMEDVEHLISESYVSRRSQDRPGMPVNQ